MIRYRFNVGEALARVGVNTYTIKKTNVISIGAYLKLCAEDTRISLATLDKVCTILDMQPKDLIYHEEDKDEQEPGK